MPCSRGSCLSKRRSCPAHGLLPGRVAGVRMTPTLNREVKPEALYDEVMKRFGFSDPYASKGEGDS